MKFPVDKNFFLDRSIRSGYAIAFLLLLVSYILIFSTNTKLQQQAQAVENSNNIITHLESLQSIVTDAETGVRGYMIGKDNYFLEPYYNSEKNIDSSIGKLRTITILNPLQKKMADTLNRLIIRRLQILKAGKSMFDKNGGIVTDSLKTLLYSGKKAMDEVRELTQRMKTEERRNLKQGNTELKEFRGTIKVINITSLFIAFLLIAYSFITYNRENKLKKQADTQTLLYSQELEEKIKDLKEANEELIELRRNEKFAFTGRMARTIAHEVKNPLTNIGLAAEQLKDVVPQNEESNLLFGMIARNSTRINQLVTDLLNSTKTLHLKFEKVSVNHLLDEALEMAEDRIELNHIKVEKKYTADICDVTVDKEQIKIAFLNLIVNAVEATEAGKGVLHLKTDNKNDKCVVTIEDNGIGMKEEDLTKLFEPFFTNKPKGTGLGLTNTQSIILNHKGTINVESKPSKGTKFEITLDFA